MMVDLSLSLLPICVPFRMHFIQLIAGLTTFNPLPPTQLPSQSNSQNSSPHHLLLSLFLSLNLLNSPYTTYSSSSFTLLTLPTP